ncbi:hypothetical protein K501DRAFT_204149, partial [Backusella circina FSU 941]
PQKGGNFYPKVPSLIAYKKSDPSVMVEWGHSAKKVLWKPHGAKEYILLSNFKLDLDESLQRGLAENLKSPVDNIADYLGALHRYVMEEVTKGFARNYSPDTFRYCLTVPAMWSDRAKNTMRQAAIKAQLVTENDPQDRLLLISEPEAAALYCERMCEQVNLSKGDRMIICDAGGGTVDLITFEIVNENKNSTNRLKEVTRGVGESCGSVFLDHRFMALITKKLGGGGGGGNTEHLSSLSLNSLLEQFIDMIKPEFDGLEDQYLSLPSSIQLDKLDVDNLDFLDEGMITLGAEELKEHVFDPVVELVLNLLEKQYNEIPDKRVECIFLVGGFGSSNYLYQKVTEAFEGRVKQVLCPPRAPLAVVRGAAYFGLNPRAVTSRISRRTYGINAGLPFDNARDPISSRVIRPDGSVRCATRFLTFVQKGDELPVDHCIRETMFVYYGTMRTTDIILYSTDQDNEPRYFDEPHVQQVAAISVPIPYIPNLIYNQRISYTVK